MHTKTESKRTLDFIPALLRVSCLFICTYFGTIEADTVQRHNTKEMAIEVELVTSGLKRPWSIAFIDKDHWLVTERGGQLRQVEGGKLRQTPVKGLPDISASGQGGLLDVRLHPAFNDNSILFLSYVAEDKTGRGIDVIRARLQNNRLVNTKTIFSADPRQGGGRHFGSRLEFDSEGLLYISLGDRGERTTAQNGLSHAGSIIRLTESGAVPPDNPFLDTETVRNEIYSMGHRNVQGMVYDPVSDSLWAHEHGPQGGDELNLVEKGRNYGWPVVTYGANYGTGSKIGQGYEKEGMQQPLTYWTPSIAPSGLAIVDSDKFPEWRGNLLVGALKYQLIARLELEQGRVISEERLLQQEYGRIRDIRQGPDGYLYFLTDSGNGKIYRIRPSDQ